MDTFPLMKESAYQAESQDPHKPASGKTGAVQSAPAVSDTRHRTAAGKVILPAAVQRVSRGSALFGRFADQRIIMLQHRRQANKHVFAHQCPGLLDPGA